MQALDGFLHVHRSDYGLRLLHLRRSRHQITQPNQVVGRHHEQEQLPDSLQASKLEAPNALIRRNRWTAHFRVDRVADVVQVFEGGVEDSACLSARTLLRESILKRDLAVEPTVIVLLTVHLDPPQ